MRQRAASGDSHLFYRPVQKDGAASWPKLTWTDARAASACRKSLGFVVRFLAGAATSGVTGRLEDVHLQRDMELLGQKNSLVGLTGVPANFRWVP